MMLVVALSAGVFAFSGSSRADTSAVTGSAFGYYAYDIVIFGGAQDDTGPTPVVVLPSGGSATPVSASAPSGVVQYGPATLFSSGPLEVSTQGATGEAGSVTSSTDIQDVNTSGQEVFTASNVSSTCTASEAGVSGSTTIIDGTLQTSEGDPNVEGDETVVTIPTNPAANTAYEGTIESVGDSFRYVFNEQTTNADGSLT
ncbi:MAG TPA: hypothetical protein VG452_09465, partial [Egibacteraceae bacterium]|nr:hypothetical protein [Egibacteraceae bacterium]